VSKVQPGILAAIPRRARYLHFSLHPEAKPGPVLKVFCAAVQDEEMVLGLGSSLVLALGGGIPGLKTFPSLVGPGFDVPSTPMALWCWLRGSDQGELVHRTRLVRRALAGAFRLEHIIDAFQYGASLDLTGYEDGTENPKGDAALAVAIVDGQGAGLDGSSFVAVQQWVHDLDHFDTLGPDEQDLVMGRHRIGNAEIEDAPPSAHVKRTAQESFEPEAFILRRSMPWADAERVGLVFVAFGASLDAFETLLKHMTGADDGITDELFRFTHPATGGYYWCPPLRDGRLDLRALGL
jgi:putative iron-dependent peroxidase